jgi:F-type H+-transporting ATPase subunit alpha
MKQVAGSLRLDLAAYRELEAFAQLGTELDTATQRQLDRGKCMVELLKQPQYQPFNVNDQVLSIFTGSKGYLDDLPVNRVAEFEAAMLARFHEKHADLVRELDEKAALSDELAEKIGQAIADFKAQFVKRD